MFHQVETRSRTLLWLPVACALLALALVTGGCGGEEPAQGVDDEAAGEPVTIVQLAPPAMLEALAAGEIDGFVAWEPFPAKAVEAGTGAYLIDSSQTWEGHPCCVLATVREGFPKDVQTALLWAHVRATDFLTDPANEDEVLEYAMEFTGYSEVVVEESLAHMTFTDTIALDGLQEYYSHLVQQDLLTKGPALDDETATRAFWDSFVNDEPLDEVRRKLRDDPGWVPAAVSPSPAVRLGFISKDLHELAVFIAEKEGYFATVGLESGDALDLRPFPNGVAIMQAFQTGELDASYLGAAPAILKGVNDEVPITMLAGANTEGTALVVGAATGVESVPELGGRTVAVPQVGTVQYVLLRRLLDQNGMTSELQ